MIIYKLNKKKPYSILGFDKYTELHIVAGTAEDVEIPEGKVFEGCRFGGFAATWKMRKEDFLTKEHKQVLKWIKKHEGQAAHDKMLDRIYESEISAHTRKYS